LVLRELGPAIAQAGEEPDDFDHKSRLQEKAVRDGNGTPRYVVVGSGPDHDRAYVAEVFLAGELHGTGTGRSKKDAEQEAARNAWEVLQGAEGGAGADAEGAAAQAPAETEAEAEAAAATEAEAAGAERA
jgi:ribonuclease-3